MDRYERTYSTRYEETKELSHKELAKLIRKEVRIYMQQYNKKYKISVKLSSYNSIDIYVEFVEIANPYSKGFTNSIIANENSYMHNDCMHKMYNNEIITIIRDLENIRKAFNYDGSDLQTDYFDARYYGSTDFNSRNIYSIIKENPEQYVFTEEEVETELCSWIDAYRKESEKNSAI